MNNKIEKDLLVTENKGLTLDMETLSTLPIIVEAQKETENAGIKQDRIPDQINKEKKKLYEVLGEDGEKEIEKDIEETRTTLEVLQKKLQVMEKEEEDFMNATILNPKNFAKMTVGVIFKMLTINPFKPGGLSISNREILTFTPNETRDELEERTHRVEMTKKKIAGLQEKLLVLEKIKGK